MKHFVMVGAVLAALTLSSCASMQDFFNVLSGTSAQKITRTPIWVYKPDLRIAVDGKVFDGIGVTAIADQTVVSIWSAVNIDRVEVSSCARHDVCQIKGGVLACDQRTSDNPNGRFDVDTGWFGKAGKSMQYYFRPDRKERDDSCANLMIAIYDKNSLAAWGFLDFRNPAANFPAKFTCNATDWNFAGVSVCSAKAGTIQQINFGDPVDDYRTEDSCHLKKVSNTEFEFQPAIGWCRTSFMRNKLFHDVIINGYDEVLIRDGQD